MSDQKKKIIHRDHLWTIDATDCGVDLFCDGGYYTTLLDEDDQKSGIAYWLKAGEQHILSLKEI